MLNAAIIEMALLNCTCVFAVMTDKTKGLEMGPLQVWEHQGNDGG